MLARIGLVPVQRFYSIGSQYLFSACLMTFKLHNLAYFLRIFFFFFFFLLIFLQLVFVPLFLFS